MYLCIYPVRTSVCQIPLISKCLYVNLFLRNATVIFLLRPWSWYINAWYIWATVCQSQTESKNDYSLSSFHHEFRRKRKPDFAEEESVGLLKALRRGRRD